MTELKGWQKTLKRCFKGGMALTFGLGLSTLVYYLGWMPRTPQPSTGRIYPTGAAFNTLVYVTKSELVWMDFIKYDLMSAVGIGALLFAILALIPASRRSGQL